MELDKDPEDPHPDFLKGYNEGYLLSKYAPEIGGLFGAYAPQTERGKGFRKGKEQYVLEMAKDHIPEYLKDYSDNKSSMDVNKEEKDRDGLLKDYSESRSDMELKQGEDRIPDYLKDIDDNKADMDLDRGEPERDISDIEPERD